MIKVLHKVYGFGYDVWRDGNITIKKTKTLKSLITEFIDEDNWTIIAATTEYIILQKYILDKGMEKALNEATKFFGIDLAKGEHSEFTPEKEAEKKVSSKKVI